MIAVLILFVGVLIFCMMNEDDRNKPALYDNEGECS